MNARALLWLAGAQAAIGAAAIFARVALTAAGPLSVAALRLGIAAAPVAALALRARAYERFDRATERRLALAGCALALHFGTWIASLQHASVAVSTLLVCSAPVFTELWHAVRTRTLRPLALASLALGIGGIAIVAGAPGATDTPLGIALALCGAVAIAAYLVLVRASDARYTTLAVIGRTYPIAALVLLAAVAASGVHTVPPLHARGAWAAIFALAFVSQLFGHTALNAAVRTLSATFVATTTLLEPIIAAALASVAFGEHLALRTVAGAMLVLTAIALAIRAEFAPRSL